MKMWVRKTFKTTSYKCDVYWPPFFICFFLFPLPMSLSYWEIMRNKDSAHSSLHSSVSLRSFIISWGNWIVLGWVCTRSSCCWNERMSYIIRTPCSTLFKLAFWSHSMTWESRVGQSTTFWYVTWGPFLRLEDPIGGISEKRGPGRKLASTKSLLWQLQQKIVS